MSVTYTTLGATLDTSKAYVADFQSYAISPDDETVPIWVLVTHYHREEGTTLPQQADNDADYYGYSEFEFYVLDAGGHICEELAELLSEEDDKRIEWEYEQFLSQQNAMLEED